MIKFAAFEVPFETGNSRDFGPVRLENEINEWMDKNQEAEYINHTVTFLKSVGSGPDSLLITIVYTVDPS